MVDTHKIAGLTSTELSMLGLWTPSASAERRETPLDRCVFGSLCWDFETAPNGELQSWYYNGLEFWRELHGQLRSFLSI